MTGINTVISTLLYLVGMVILSNCYADTFNDTHSLHLGYPSWFAESPFLDLKEELSNAKSEGKKGLMVVLSAKGCTYCDRFIKTVLNDPAISRQIISNFRSIALDVFSDTEMTSPTGQSYRVKDFALKENVQFTPSVLFYDLDAKMMLRVVGYQPPQKFTRALEYVSGGHYKEVSYSNYLAKKTRATLHNKDYTLTSGVDIQIPIGELNFDRLRKDKPLLIIFDEINCSECVDFYQHVIAKKFVKVTLKKFNVVRLNAKDNKTHIFLNNKKRTTPAAWYTELELNHRPSLLFLTPDGKEIVKTDSVVMPFRMMILLYYVLEKGYEQGWTYQKYAKMRGQEIKKLMN